MWWVKKNAYVLQVLEEVGDSLPFAVGEDWLVESIAGSPCAVIISLAGQQHVAVNRIIPPQHD